MCDAERNLYFYFIHNDLNYKRHARQILALYTSLLDII